MSDARFMPTQQTGGVLVVAPLFTSASFAEPAWAAECAAVHGQIDSAAVQHVVVDLEQLPYFGSTVLEWMVQLWKRVRARGGRFAVCNASPIGREVLGIVRFDQLWPIHDSRAAAVAALESPAA